MMHSRMADRKKAVPEIFSNRENGRKENRKPPKIGPSRVASALICTTMPFACIS